MTRKEQELLFCGILYLLNHDFKADEIKSNDTEYKSEWTCCKIYVCRDHEDLNSFRSIKVMSAGWLLFENEAVYTAYNCDDTHGLGKINRNCWKGNI